MKEGQPNNKSKNKKINKELAPVTRVLKIVGTTILCLIMIMIITCSIVATALTVYVMNFMDNSTYIDLEDIKQGTSTFVYANGNDGEAIQIGSLSNGEKRIWVDYEDIPKYVKDAFICSEDTRFYSHDGVDFKRTFSSFINMFLPIYNSRQGGSTITQQLVKNFTGDDEDTVSRKIREIFSAIALERNYTKEDILEGYLNIIYLSNNCYGIQAASNFYFDKDVSELTIAEASCIAAMTKSPNANNPFNNFEKNTERRNYVLKTMYENGAISTDEYESALTEELHLVGYDKIGDDGQVVSNVTSYFYDAAVNQAISIFMDQYNLSYEDAQAKLKTGGYRVYTTENPDIQTELENKYKDPLTFGAQELKDPPNASGIIMDYYGNIVGIVGNIGEKTVSRGTVNPVDLYRAAGSCIKPVASYGPAIMNDLITWSTLFKDDPIEIYDYSTGQTVKKPNNYSGYWTHQYNTVTYFLRRSINTTPAQIIHNYLGEQASYDWLVNKLHFKHLDKNDIALSPLSVGSLTYGMTLEELVASYQIFGNAGKYYQPTFIKRITDSKGTIAYEHRYISEQPMDSESAWVMNRLLKEVTTNTEKDPETGAFIGGTGTAASKSLNVEVVGKTGTSDDEKDILFIGCTPEYVSGIWYGYLKPANKSTKGVGYYNSGTVWNNVYRDILNSVSTIKTFTADPNVVKLEYCKDTGLIAGPNCTNTAYGYYKSTNIPPQCTGNHEHEDENTDSEETTTSGSDNNINDNNNSNNNSNNGNNNENNNNNNNGNGNNDNGQNN